MAVFARFLCLRFSSGVLRQYLRLPMAHKSASLSRATPAVPCRHSTGPCFGLGQNVGAQRDSVATAIGRRLGPRRAASLRRSTSLDIPSRKNRPSAASTRCQVDCTSKTQPAGCVEPTSGRGASNGQPPPTGSRANATPIDLPTALRLVDANSPTVALARQRVQEAFLRQRNAELAWLPDLQAGPTYDRHDGRDQGTNGVIVEESKQNLFVGGGAILDWNTSEIIFGRLTAARLADAARANAPGGGQQRSTRRGARLLRSPAILWRICDLHRCSGPRRRNAPQRRIG